MSDNRHPDLGRRLWIALVACLLVESALRAAEPDASSSPSVGVTSIASNVSDLDRSVAFYVNVLDFERTEHPAQTDDEQSDDRPHRTAWLRLGDEAIELREVGDGAGRPYPPGSRSHDRWFQHVAIVVKDMDRAYKRLRDARVVHISSGPQTLPEWNQAAAGIQAFYFRDPDGQPLELIFYPPGKRQDRWQTPTNKLFLGIDHTAIAVADTEAALRFYRDELGLTIAGGSENHGFEQEHLSGVFASRVRITTLRGAFGPGVELLEYIAPSDGRPSPADLQPFDLVFRETRFTLAHPTSIRATRDVRRLRDPDGHPVVMTRQ